MENPGRTYDITYQQLFGITPPSSVTVGESEADIISQGRGFVDAFDLTMQLQVGCPGGCLFCYVPSGTRLVPQAIKGPQGQSWGFQVRNKQNIIQRLKYHLAKGNLADKTIYWSGVTDPYKISTPK
jgi:DNA repair photolyase